MSKHIQVVKMGPRNGAPEPGDFRPRMMPKDQTEAPKDSSAPASAGSSPAVRADGTPLPPMRPAAGSSTPGEPSDSTTSVPSPSPQSPSLPLPPSVGPGSDASAEKDQSTPDESGTPRF